jgi:hypothetical protein
MGLLANKRSDLSDSQNSQILSGRDEIELDKALMAKHEDSLRRYPRIHLSRGEYVVMEVRRHPIGLISIWIVSGLLTLLVLGILPLYAMTRDALAHALAMNVSSLPEASALALPVFGLAILFVLGGIISNYVYSSNLFYLTNESIIQYVQTSLFSTKEQVINLVNVDDASYRQDGIVQQVFNYGTVRVTTEGDERNPYIFFYVAKPQHVVRTINDAMEEATGFAVRYRQHREGTPPPTTPSSGNPTGSGVF